MSCKAWKALVVAILGLVALPEPGYSEQDSLNTVRQVDIQTAWFKPTLTANADPACGSFLAAVQAKFVSVDSNYSHLKGFANIPGPFQQNNAADPRLQFLPDNPRQFVFSINRGEKLFGYFQNHSGCGGACEKESVHISPKPIDEKNTDLSLPSIASTPLASWSLLKDGKGVYYVEGEVDQTLQLYRIVSPKIWKLSCEVQLKPEMPPKAPESFLQPALRAIEALNGTTGNLSRGAGSCGSSGTPWRWRNAIGDGLYETLYRPWALTWPRCDNCSENSYGDYSRIEKQLRQWSLGGMKEYQDFKKYQEQLTTTTRELADFYEKQFGWSKSKSSGLARDAVRNAISQGFGFYMYTPFASPAEEQLRAAILAHRPITEIRSIDIENQLEDFSRTDSILNVAIDYPEALRYLLKKGADANAANSFGKTPLMYAAQFNQLESAKLLLAAGANPNAETTIPLDSCGYTLQTSHMTALHYAARYASLPLIKLLTSGGSITFAQSNNTQRGVEYPIDWLHRYTNAKSAIERNPNLSASDVAEAASLLHVPSDSERKHIATSMVLQAEKDYAAGKFESSYRALKIASVAAPDNKKAVSDLPLVSLKAGHVGQAIKAAANAVKTLKEPPLAASAWFNFGLICERKEAQAVFDYDGSQCGRDKIEPFARAWRLEPTNARNNKLTSFFKPKDSDLCQRVQVFSLSGVKDGRYSQIQRIYILHRPEEAIAPENISWTITFADRPSPTVINSTLVAQMALNSEVISVYDGPYYGKPPTINGLQCAP